MTKILHVSFFLIVISLTFIPNSFATYHDNPPMVVSTAKSSYNSGDIVTISGSGAQSYVISIQILAPSGDSIAKFQTFKSGAGEFSTVWIVPGGAEYGTYTIKASDATETAQTTFNLGTETLQKPETSSDSKTSIPEWIRNNAKWWSEGLIGDSDFTSGIQYMIKEKIIDIPDLPETASSTAEEKIPDWIKNNAGWWANGQIDEDTFVNALKYLVEKGIIRV